jgi:glycosyltransferase involved in cell wall biosynthesis
MENNDFPRVSVLLITYNHEKFVGDAIDSILIQNYPNMEVVIGDDGSTDKTPEILHDYRNKYPEIIRLVISPTNMGITENCNRILKECNGEYVAMFAGDDLWLPGKIKKQVELFQRNPDAVFCYSKTDVFDSDSGRTIVTFPDFKKAEDYSSFNDILEFTYSIGWSVPSFMFLKKAIPENGFEKSIPNVSDWLFWIETIRKGKVVFIDEVLARYRRHSGNISKNLILIFTEHLMTLNIIEKRYPDLKFLAKKKRMSTLMNLIAQVFNDNIVDSRFHRDLYQFSLRMDDLAHKFIEKFKGKPRGNQQSGGDGTDDFRFQISQNLVSSLERYLMGSNSVAQKDDVRLLRQKMANFCLNLSSKSLVKNLQSDFGRIFHKLMKSNIRNEMLSDGEKYYVQFSVREIDKRFRVNADDTPNYLFVLMLYLPKGKLNITEIEKKLPDWVLRVYEEYF